MRCLQSLPVLAGLCLSPALTLAQATLPDTSSLAFLSVYSQSIGLSVLIAGNEVGTTPLRKFPLSAGHYEIVVRNTRAASWLDEDWQQSVTLAPRDSLTLIARMIHGYLINSVPYGAHVWWNGKLLGTTPYVLRLPEDRIAHIEVRRPGYVTMQVEVGRREEALAQKRRYDLALARDLNFSALQQQTEMQRRARSGFYRKLTYLSATISLASGVGAALLKRRADDAYARYLVTGDPLARERDFNRAEKYDRYYAVAFAAFEVSFAVSFYSFLKALKK